MDWSVCNFTFATNERLSQTNPAMKSEMLRMETAMAATGKNDTVFLLQINFCTHELYLSLSVLQVVEVPVNMRGPLGAKTVGNELPKGINGVHL